MTEAGLERNENIFRFTNPTTRLRNRPGNAVRWPALARLADAGHIAGERTVKGRGTKPFRWTKSADDIRVAINRSRKRTIDEHRSAMLKTSESRH
ncbi:MAG: hypothetical protein ACR2KT_11205 [Methylocella sp.]|nr:MAG: hypothetical protein DLM68_02325 [Hyphomicrobiales bacterium]